MSNKRNGERRKPKFQHRPKAVLSTTTTMVWHSASATKPDTDMSVLVSTPGASDPIQAAFWDGTVWRDLGAETINDTVTFWGDYPESPEEAA